MCLGKLQRWSYRILGILPARLVTKVAGSLRACLSVRFQGFTPTPPYRPSASSRLWPARPAALCLPDPCGLDSDSHGGNVFSGKLLEFLTQTGSNRGHKRLV